jgi:hypothetical protein
MGVYRLDGALEQGELLRRYLGRTPVAVVIRMANFLSLLRLLLALKQPQ